MRFRDVDFDEFLITDNDFSNWAIINKSQIVKNPRSAFTNDKATTIKSSDIDGPSSLSVKNYNPGKNNEPDIKTSDF